MRIPGNFIPPSTFTRLGNTSLILKFQFVSLVALAILVVKFAVPAAKQFYARLFHPSPAPIDNPDTLLVPNLISVPLDNPNPVPIPVDNSDLVPLANPIFHPLANPEYIQNANPAPIDDKPEGNAVLREPVQLPVVPQITMDDVCNHINAEENKLSPLQQEKLNTINSVRFRSLGSLALLNEDTLNIICRIAGPVSFQGSRGMRNIAIRLQNGFEFSKGRVEKQFCNAIICGDYSRSLQLIKEMQAHWGENFEHHFLQLNFDLGNLLLFSNLIEFSNEASTPPTIRSLIHFKMIEIPFTRFNSDFIYRNILVLCQANHKEEVKTLLFKMFVEIRLFEPFPWGLQPSPVNYEELPLPLLVEWMEEFIEKMNPFKKTNVKDLFKELLAAFEGELYLTSWPRPVENFNILSCEGIRQAAANSFTSALLKNAPIPYKYFIEFPPSSNPTPQDLFSVAQIKIQRHDFKNNIGKQVDIRIKSIRDKRYKEIEEKKAIKHAKRMKKITEKNEKFDKSMKLLKEYKNEKFDKSMKLLKEYKKDDFFIRQARIDAAFKKMGMTHAPATENDLSHLSDDQLIDIFLRSHEAFLRTEAWAEKILKEEG